MKRDTALFLTAVVVAAVIRLAALGRAELWYDEAFTLNLARLPFDRMIQATAGDTHPPLYYLLTWIWVRLAGESEFSLRLPSVIASLAGLVVFWRIAHSQRLALSPSARWLALAFMVLSPWQVYFAQEARMYQLVQLVVLLAALAILENRAGLFAVSLAAMLWLHNYGLFYYPILAAAWLYYQRADLAQNRKRHMAALGLPVLAWLPWAGVLIYQMSFVAQGYWIEPVTPGAIIYTLSLILFGPFTRQFVIIAVLVAAGLIAWAGLRWIASRGSARTPLIPWLAFAPFVVAILASLIWHPVFLWRGMTGAAPWLYLWVSAPLAALGGWRRLYVAALIIPAMLAGLLGYWLDIIAFKSTTQAAIAAVRAAWLPGDIVYSTSDGTLITWLAYWPDAPIYLMPDCDGGHDKGALSQHTRQALGANIAMLDHIDYRRAWLLYNFGAQTNPCNARQAQGLIGDTPPWLLVEDKPIVTSGIWLLNR